MKNTAKFLMALTLAMFLMVPASAVNKLVNSDEITVVNKPDNDKKEKKESTCTKEKACCDKKAEKAEAKKCDAKCEKACCAEKKKETTSEVKKG